MSYSIANAIVRGAWLMDPQIARSYMPMILGVLKGQSQFEPLTDEERVALQPYDVNMNSHVVSSSGASGVPTNERVIRVIPVKGIIMKETEMCGPVGSLDRAKMINAAANDDRVSAVVLKFDSPGGMVSGTQTFADAIRNCHKPVIGFIEDGICASACYWFASECDEIISSHATNTVGSIGVYVSLADMNGYFKKEGLTIHEIYADQSSEKNKGYRDAMKGDYKKIKENSLNPIAEKFIATVKENRKGKLNLSEADPFKGDTYMSDRALKIGLIDSIGSFEDAVNRAAALSQNTPKASAEITDDGTKKPENPDTLIQENNTTMKVKILSTQKHLAAVLGVTFNEGETEAEVELTPENIAAIESNMETTATELATANAEVTRLGKQPGAMGKSVKQEKEKEGTEAAAEEPKGFTTAADETVAKMREEAFGKEDK